MSAFRSSLNYDEIVAKLREAYDGRADERESRAGLTTPWKLVERAAFLDRIQAQGAQTLLDLGAGTGRDSLFFKQQGLDVVAVDLSPRMIAHCLAKGIDARVDDFLHLALPPSSFEAVYALNSLLHVPNADLPDAFERIRRVMRPGGLFFLGVYGGRPYEGALESDTHEPPRFFALRTDDHLRDLVAPHFEIVDFHTVDLDAEDQHTMPLEVDDFHFQAVTLRHPR